MVVSLVRCQLSKTPTKQPTKNSVHDVRVKGSLRERRPGNWELIVRLPRDPEPGLRKQLGRTHRGTKREMGAPYRIRHFWDGVGGGCPVAVRGGGA